MRRHFAVFSVIMMLPILGWGQLRHKEDVFDKYLNKYLETDNRADLSTEDLHAHLNKLERKKASVKSDLDFLSYLFNKTHTKFLKDYREHAAFSELLINGRYNCLTATALYALLLDHFGYTYSIIETNYHIFLQVTLRGKPILFETTDPIYGFVTSEKEIAEKVALYRQNRVQKTGQNKPQYQFNFNLYNSVGLDQLTGLLYYNLAVEAFNKSNLSQCIFYLNKAVHNYRSTRIEEFSKIILLALAKNNFNNSQSNAY